MYAYYRTSRNTGVGVGGCLGVILLLALSWAFIGFMALTFTAALWAVLGAVALFATWVILWVAPVSIYRGMLVGGWGVPAAAGAAWGWIVLVLALAGWIAL